MPNFHDIYRRRLYRHFDSPLSLAEARALATSPRRVEGHSFLPFIRRDTFKICRNQEDGTVLKKPRILAYAGHADSAIYGWYGALLLQEYEKRLRDLQLGSVPVAYRRFSTPRCNIHFALNAFTYISQNTPCVAFGFDIKGFFDHIDHRLLRQAWCDILGHDWLIEGHHKVYSSLTRWASVEEKALYSALGAKWRKHPNEPSRLCTAEFFRSHIRDGMMIEVNRLAHGIPQGSPMSGVLSNIYMLPFDQTLQRLAALCGGFVQRYSDDILVVVPVSHRDEAIETVLTAAQERKLTVQDKKTDEVMFSGGILRAHERPPLQYLGLTFDGENILIRSNTLNRHYRKLRMYVRSSVKRAVNNPRHPGIYRRMLHRRFTHRGGRNFHTYVDRCRTICKSQSIKIQVRSAWVLISKWEQELLHTYRRGNQEHSA